jgi:DNA-binding MarR family transcriptional regulator
MVLKQLLIPHIGKTAKLMSFCIGDQFIENNIKLTKEQWLLLKKLHERNGQIQNDLAFITDRSKTSLTRLIGTMEKKGLVYRVGCEADRRVNRVYYTEKGRDIFAQAEPVFLKVIEQLTENLSEEQVKLTFESLKQIIKNAEKITKPIL